MSQLGDGQCIFNFRTPFGIQQSTANDHNISLQARTNHQQSHQQIRISPSHRRIPCQTMGVEAEFEKFRGHAWPLQSGYADT